MLRLYNVTLLIYLIGRVCNKKKKKIPDWMKHKLESRFPGENISNLRYADDTTLMAEGDEEIKSLLMKVKEKNKKAGLKLIT